MVCRTSLAPAMMFHCVEKHDLLLYTTSSMLSPIKRQPTWAIKKRSEYTSNIKPPKHFAILGLSLYRGTESSTFDSTISASKIPDYDMCLSISTSSPPRPEMKSLPAV